MKRLKRESYIGVPSGAVRLQDCNTGAIEPINVPATVCPLLAASTKRSGDG